MSQAPTVGVIVVAAGRGERLGADLPKAYVPLNGVPMLHYSIHTIASLPQAGQLVLVVPADRVEPTTQLAKHALPPESRWQLTVVPGGHERDASVRNGLAQLTSTVDTVLVHDAARPLTPATQFTRIIEHVRRTGHSVIPALPVTDTIKRVLSDGVVRETVDRSTLMAVQTPQGFPRDTLDSAHAMLVHLSSQAEAETTPLPTDDAEVVQQNGGTVLTQMGDSLAMKVTTPHDLTLLTAILNMQSTPHRSSAPTVAPAVQP